MHALCNIAEESETLGALLAEPDAVHACVHMLAPAKDAAVRREAAATLAHLADAGLRVPIINAKGVPPLVALLRRGGADLGAELGGNLAEELELGRLEAARALEVLADDAASHAATAAGLPQLVALAGGESLHNGSAAGGADGSHAALSGARDLEATGGVPAEAQRVALSTLHKLACGGEPSATNAMATSRGAMALLVGLLRDANPLQVGQPSRKALSPSHAAESRHPRASALSPPRSLIVCLHTARFTPLSLHAPLPSHHPHDAPWPRAGARGGPQPAPPLSPSGGARTDRRRRWRRRARHSQPRPRRRHRRRAVHRAA